MPRSLDDWRRSEATALPGWIKPQLTRLVDQAPDGPDWLHEIKFDGYRMHARLDRGAVRLLTRTGLDWTSKYPPIAAALTKLPARQAYLDGELCGVRPDGTTSFSLIQNASDTGNSGALVFFLFDLIHLDGEARLIRAAQQSSDVLRRMRFLVRMRKAIAQVLPDAPVIPVARQTRSVFGPIGTHHALARSQIDHAVNRDRPEDRRCSTRKRTRTRRADRGRLASWPLLAG